MILSLIMTPSIIGYDFWCSCDLSLVYIFQSQLSLQKLILIEVFTSYRVVLKCGLHPPHVQYIMLVFVKLHNSFH